MISYDSHVHTAFSTDSETSMDKMAACAARLGLKGITFTDHMDYHFPDTYNWKPAADGLPPFTFDLEKYLLKIHELAETYQETLSIQPGVEIGLKDDAYEDNCTLSHDSRLSYCIGSIHLVDDKDPYYPDYWETFGEENGLLKYFETTLAQLEKLGEIKIDTLGHLDYIVRYAPSGYDFYSYQRFSGVIDEILRILINRGISLEINTSGYKNGGPMPNPGEDIIRRYRDMGGEWITFGSDAHDTERLGKMFYKAEELVKKTGLCHYITFSDHKPVVHTF